jgi:hypothetical protein
MPITVPYKVLAKGYSITGDARSGLKATVPYLLAWGDALTFAAEILTAPSATVIGPVAWFAPLQFPVPIAGQTKPLYAQRFSIVPEGASNSAVPTKGLAPGEFFTKAVVTVEFETPAYPQTSGDDPNGFNQLDPSNPITACEQSVHIGGRMQTVKGRGYKYQTSGKPVPGDMAIPAGEVKLRLKFPRIPYLPWGLIAPYINKINQNPILQVNTGALLLEGMDTEETPGTDGSMQQSLVLEFAVNLVGIDDGSGLPVGTDWNKQPLNDGSGTWDYVVAASASTKFLFGYADFRNIFTKITF